MRRRGTLVQQPPGGGFQGGTYDHEPVDTAQDADQVKDLVVSRQGVGPARQHRADLGEVSFAVRGFTRELKATRRLDVVTQDPVHRRGASAEDEYLVAAFVQLAEGLLCNGLTMAAIVGLAEGRQ